jgi:hypothetical protein
MESSEDELFAYLWEVNVRRCESPIEEGEVREIVRSAMKWPMGESMLPSLWFNSWLPFLETGSEAKVASAIYLIAEAAGRMNLTPAEKTILEKVNLSPSSYYEGRKHLEKRGAIYVSPRKSPDGSLKAPSIRLIQNPNVKPLLLMYRDELVAA